MKFSTSGYHVERYVKCANCGKLIFAGGIARDVTGASARFCSQWCIDWLVAREARQFDRLPDGATERAATDARWDVVTMNIVESAMISICREMGISMMKTAYSTIFNEGLDFTCGLADRDGELIAVAEYCPSMIGGMPLIIKTIVQEIPLEEFQPGDIVMHNDPHRGGLHLPEHTLIKPIFIADELVGFSVCIGHVAEIGGAVPGAFNGEATEIFQEGLVVPPVKIKVRGEDNRDVWKLVLANVRTPRYNYGDLRAMIGAVDLGERRMIDLIRKYGIETFRTTCRDLLDYAERRMRAEIASFPDGRYGFDDVVENDGIEARQYRIHVDVHVRGDEFIADFTGSDPQARGPINCTLAVAMGATYNAVLHMTDPSIPRNSGAFRPIRILAPPGTIANVNHPAPEVAGNTEVHPRFCGVIFGAMAQCVPERVMASEANTGGNFVFGGVDPENGEYFVCYDVMYGGWGGRAEADGNNTVVTINGNCRHNPTEVFETRYPWRVETFALTQDSGGAGRHRGGLGFSRTLLATSVDMTVSQCTDHHEVPPWALFGGKPGGLGSTLIRHEGTKDWRTVKEAFNKASSSKFARVTVRPGDRVRITVPGGGGFGDPRSRNPGLIENDLAEGYISRRKAMEDYGYAPPD
ncbi:MAG: hydantoinase B/oxoprolinase family protein [Parvibaculaceae bacterium]